MGSAIRRCSWSLALPSLVLSFPFLFASLFQCLSFSVWEGKDPHTFIWGEKIGYTLTHAMHCSTALGGPVLLPLLLLLLSRLLVAFCFSFLFTFAFLTSSRDMKTLSFHSAVVQ